MYVKPSESKKKKKKKRQKSWSNLLQLPLEETKEVIFLSRDSNFFLIWVNAVSIFFMWPTLTALLFLLTITALPSEFNITLGWLVLLPFNDTKRTTKTTKYFQRWTPISATHCFTVALPSSDDVTSHSLLRWSFRSNAFFLAGPLLFKCWLALTNDKIALTQE